MTLKAIIFDMDETLLDWRGRSQNWEDYQRDHLGRVFSFVNEKLHPLPSPELFFEQMQANAVAVWMDSKYSLIAPHLGEVLLQTLVELGVPRQMLKMDDCLRAYEMEPVAGVQPFPDVLPELARLKSYGLRFGLLTNAFHPMHMRDVELRAMGLMPFFEDGCRISAADVGYLKPHPKIFEESLRCMGITPQEAVFVGDSLEADIAGAQGVGMKAVLRDRAESPLGEEESEIIPDGKISSLSDLYPLLDQWYPDWTNGKG